MTAPLVTRVAVEAPWLVMGPIRLNASFLDRLLSTDAKLLVGVDDLLVKIHVPEGSDAAQRIQGQLAPYTRWSPITQSDVYQNALDRYRVFESSTVEDRRKSLPNLIVGEQAVYARDEFLYVGKFAFRVDDVIRHGLRGGNIHLPEGVVQSALGALIIAADRRPAGDDMEALSKRIAQYEKTRVPDDRRE